MTDRELLELAAKAAGVDLCFNDAGTPGYYSDWRGMPQWEVWNPLVHDGHALRLAVKLGLAVIPYPIYAQPKHSVIAKQYSDGFTVYRDDADRIERIEIYGDDPAAATRRAIVRAAAAIGSAKTGEAG